MAAPADVIFVDGEIHTLADPDRTAEALAARDGRVVRVGDTYEIEFLEGIETTRIDLDGHTAVPGFVDAHSHLLRIGLRRRRADLAGAADPDAALERLRADADRDREWILGFDLDLDPGLDANSDETALSDENRLRQADLDSVSADRPVAAFHSGMRTVVCNSVAVDRLPTDAESGPPGVYRWPESEGVWRAIAPPPSRTRDLIRAGADHAVSRGITTVHDDVRTAETARAYHDLAGEGDLPLRVRLDHHLSALEGDPIAAADTLGISSGFGDDRLSLSGVRVDVDGSIVDGTAWLTDAGSGVTDPDALESLRERASAAGLRVRARASGDAAVDAVLDTLADRPVIDHADLIRDEQIPALADAGAVVVGWPDVLERAPPERRGQVGRYGRLRAAGIPLAIGSDGFRMDFLSALEGLRTAGPDTRLSPTEALRAMTWDGRSGGSPAGTLTVGAPADLAVLSGSPWKRPASSIDVELTVVDGEVVR
ncbi:MAG: amidohydrolase [Halodesulfurarchaeum sp.]